VIVGRGMLANAFSDFKNDNKILVFASGVSNSLETRINEFEKEFILLENIITENKEKIFIYFSTCSIDDLTQSNTLYIEHKLKIEKYIRNSCKKYYIFRLSQVVGVTKNSTLIQYLVDKINNEEEFDIWKSSTRNLIDVEDVFKIAEFYIDNEKLSNNIINIASPYNINIIEIVQLLEKILSKKSKNRLIEKGQVNNIDISVIKPYLPEMGMLFKKEYTSDLLKKYYNRNNKK